MLNDEGATPPEMTPRLGEKRSGCPDRPLRAKLVALILRVHRLVDGLDEPSILAWSDLFHHLAIGVGLGCSLSLTLASVQVWIHGIFSFSV